MHWYDFITAFFELGAALMVALNIPAILRDKQIKGVSIWPTLFFMVWSVWNLVLFPMLGMWLAASANILILLVNGTWVYLVLHYRRKARDV